MLLNCTAAGLGSWILHVLSRRPWANDLACLYLSFPSCEMRRQCLHHGPLWGFSELMRGRL